ncbi:uncharacterized protein B0I36DRAFT_328657 [Microdochium trichocladiopsis]|uniref:Uncharacterized protein n=1 Tax=Microdochium trichocladiopsis TaxID=1682393 RepID=A0A9P9BNV8_9PEZI|nr:uncharacterized protein B0I36DRAFT_328657 [Microdochium trichocladiopsis]KAH7028133.1 hypothetical protein B0I36DRAFT_328657 [Microdochium trichocladiopsis]
MPVTIRPTSNPPRLWRRPPAQNVFSLFQRAQSQQCKSIIQSSFGDLAASGRYITPYANGFVHAAQEAYSNHHHLTIRPEDVWFAILTQLSFYINANAEALRSKFVAHEGQKDLVVVEAGTIHSVDFGGLAVRMTGEIDKNLVDKDLRKWIMPSFTTTTTTDTVTAAVLMMGSMQKYFSYGFMLTCGIPSVTLLGEKRDWEDIRARLDKLPDFGSESKQFSRLLVPILDQFVRSFDNPDDDVVLDFWNKIADRRNMGSGPDYLTGWITAFCFWDADGKVLYRPGGGGYVDDDDDGIFGLQPGKDKFVGFDATIYSQIDADDIPAGYLSVPVQVNDNGRVFDTKMVAGSVGIEVTSSGDKLDSSREHSGRRFSFSGPPEFVKFQPEVSDETGLDSLQPVTGWWIYELEAGAQDSNPGRRIWSDSP